jgi:hypothetical protein
MGLVFSGSRFELFYEHGWLVNNRGHGIQYASLFSRGQGDGLSRKKGVIMFLAGSGANILYGVLLLRRNLVSGSLSLMGVAG